MKERRWAVIAADGRHVWLGRHSDPTESELRSAARSLADTGVVGWLAITEGAYHSDDELSVMLVRSLHGTGDWAEALAAFLDRRRKALAGQP